MRSCAQKAFHRAVWRKEINASTANLVGRHRIRRCTGRYFHHEIIVPSEVQIVEVGPRDGLQNEPVVPDTRVKIELIHKLYKAGCSHIEAGSFVSKKWVPAMADSDQVMQGLNEWKQNNSHEIQQNDLILSCLVPNIKGLETAIKYHPDVIAIFGSASEAFSQKNISCSIDESLARFKSVVDIANSLDPNMKIRGYVSCVIGCPYEGMISPSQVAHVTEKMVELGCYEVSLGDTIGVGTPIKTLEMIKAVQAAIGNGCNLAIHCHDTYGQGLANILVALENGISTVDASIAGLGGCPYAKGASGNVATEDVVYLLDGMGVKCGIDMDKLVDAAEYICSALGRPSRSRAGTAIASKRRTES